MPIPAPHQVGDQLGGEGTRRAGHLDAARFDGRTPSGRPRAATHAGRAGSGSGGRARRGTRAGVASAIERRRSPATGAASPAKRAWSCTRPSPSRSSSTGRSTTRGAVVPRAGWRTSTRSSPPGQLAGEVHDDGIAVGQPAVDRGRHRGRRVDDEQVAGREELAQRVEARVHRRGVADADQQPHVVASTGRRPRAARAPRARRRARSRGTARWCGWSRS